LAVHSWHKFQRLSWRERWLLIQALLLLPITALALRWLGLRRWQSVLARIRPLKRIPAGGEMGVLVEQAHATTRMVKAAARHGFYRASCLQQSLALWWLLRRQGIASDLRIGVRKEASQFEAHAWVELWGLVLNESGHVRQRFSPFNRAIVPVEAKPR
jgi:hypothetical protein